MGLQEEGARGLKSGWLLQMAEDGGQGSLEGKCCILHENGVTEDTGWLYDVSAAPACPTSARELRAFISTSPGLIGHLTGTPEPLKL